MLKQEGLLKVKYEHCQEMQALQERRSLKSQRALQPKTGGIGLECQEKVHILQKPDNRIFFLEFYRLSKVAKIELVVLIRISTRYYLKRSYTARDEDADIWSLRESGRRIKRGW